MYSFALVLLRLVQYPPPPPFLFLSLSLPILHYSALARHTASSPDYESTNFIAVYPPHRHNPPVSRGIRLMPGYYHLLMFWRKRPKWIFVIFCRVTINVPRVTINVPRPFHLFFTGYLSLWLFESVHQMENIFYNSVFRIQHEERFWFWA